MSKMKPCPRCKSVHVSVNEIMEYNPYREYQQASCEDCNFQGSEFDFDREWENESEQEELAIKQWNELESPPMTISSNDPNKLPCQFYWGLLPYVWKRLTGWRDEYNRPAQFIGWRG